jgi:hypothetical protein
MSAKQTQSTQSQKLLISDIDNSFLTLNLSERKSYSENKFCHNSPYGFFPTKSNSQLNNTIQTSSAPQTSQSFKNLINKSDMNFHASTARLTQQTNSFQQIDQLKQHVLSESDCISSNTDSEDLQNGFIK